MNILEIIAFAIIIAIVIAIILGIGTVVLNIRDAVNKPKKERCRQIESLEDSLNRIKDSFDSNLFSFFDGYGTKSYQGVYSFLREQVSDMEEKNNELKSLSRDDDYSGMISNCAKLAEDFNFYGQKVNSLPYTRMMDSANYGRIQKSYWDSVLSMNKHSADLFITNCERGLSSHNAYQIFAIDVETVLRCVWFYATDKPYSAEFFKKAVNIFNRLVGSPHVDVTIAELYAIKQMGGEDVLRDRIRKMLKSTYTPEMLTLIASALMWINAYQAENMILQHMLSTGMQMSAKTQERLHSLTNGGGKAPSGFDVSTNSSTMYFDVSALAWKDDEYAGFFENLAFQEKTLSYSLAVRDEDKDLFITNGISVPDTAKILTKLDLIFTEEYGTAVTAKLKKCIALSGSGEENLKGILVESNECRQMGILVHVARIGKKLNIKFYTLFMPNGTRLEDQKQQVLSLSKKLSPSVVMWESSMKDTVLMAIQQLLNTEPQTAFNDGGNTAEDREVPIF